MVQGNNILPNDNNSGDEHIENTEMSTRADNAVSQEVGDGEIDTQEYDVVSDWITEGLMQDKIIKIENLVIKTNNSEAITSPISSEDYSRYESLQGQLKAVASWDTCPRRKSILQEIKNALDLLYRDGLWSKYAKQYHRDKIVPKINEWIQELKGAINDWDGRDWSDAQDANDTYNTADEIEDRAGKLQDELTKVTDFLDEYELSMEQIAPEHRAPLTDNQSQLLDDREFYDEVKDTLDTLVGDAETVKERAQAITDHYDSLCDSVSEMESCHMDTDSL